MQIVETFSLGELYITHGTYNPTIKAGPMMWFNEEGYGVVWWIIVELKWPMLDPIFHDISLKVIKPNNIYSGIGELQNCNLFAYFSG